MGTSFIDPHSVSEKKNTNDLHKFSPDYTAGQFLNNELKISPKVDNSYPWVYGFNQGYFLVDNFSINLGVFYKLKSNRK